MSKHAAVPTLWTMSFWKAAGERAVKTAAQTALVVLGMDRLDVLTTDWAGVASVAAGGAILSVLTSIASDAATGGGPSLTTEVIDEDDQP